MGEINLFQKLKKDEFIIELEYYEIWVDNEKKVEFMDKLLIKFYGICRLVVLMCDDLMKSVNDISI